MQSREFYGKMGEAIARRSILKEGEEKWEDVCHRVAEGNSLLSSDSSELKRIREFMRKGILITSGRHLSNGDKTQPQKTQTRFTNCSTAALSCIKFYLLLCGSGVGRCYDDDIMSVDFDHQPTVICVLDENHKDYDYKIHTSRREALHKFGGNSRKVLWHEVGDSREGWTKAVEMIELAAFEKVHSEKILILDFSLVRPEGSPIMGLNGRPASGPLPVMAAINKISELKGAGLPRWKQAMFVDHYVSEAVVLGGVRRSARIATKYWKDEGIFDFIQIKRPIEFIGKTLNEIEELKKEKPLSFLWSANNSVAVDDEFYQRINYKPGDSEFNEALSAHARKVFRLATECAWGDSNGEPGFLNVHKLSSNSEGLDRIYKGDFISPAEYQIEDGTEVLLKKLGRKCKAKSYEYIVNPCGEISLHVLGGFCVIADLAPFHADSLEEAEDAFRIATRFLIRVNTMPSVYANEVKRTNRIGVSLTGMHEFAWKFFKVGFRDLLDPDFESVNNEDPRRRAGSFWRQLRRFNRIVNEEAESYSRKLKVAIPHTTMTIKPAGTTSKLFGLTEGAHLPSRDFYLRNVQFLSSDPLVAEHRDKGYPVRELKSYKGTTIIGFPTKLAITELEMGGNLVIASDATPREQFQWLQLLEKHYIDGDYPERGNQVSYTLKYDPKRVGLKEFRKMLKDNLPQVKCVSILPVEDNSSYEYLPEETISKRAYNSLIAKIQESQEEVGMEHVECAGASCPIDWRDK